MYKVAIEKMLSSIRGNDIYFLAFAIGEVILFLFSWKLSKSIKKRRKDIKEKNIALTRFLMKAICSSYTLFITIITIFPLLGMFGTVCGLLGLDLAAGDMNNIKNNFFIALTSTAWGIVFSVIFKVLNAFIENGVEEQIEFAKKYLDGEEQD